MASSPYVRSVARLSKRVKLTPVTISQCQSIVGPACLPVASRTQQRFQSSETAVAPPESSALSSTPPTTELENIRLPRAVQATYLEPLRHKPTHNIKTASLQIRSYSVRNLEAFADFALRAAYYLKLPASAARPLPRITERWTVPRANFIFKKSQENFERITVRRQIDIFDGHPETVACWLGYLQKRRYYGVGLKATVWEFGGLEVAKDLDAEAERIGDRLGEALSLVGGEPSLRQKMEQLVEIEPFKSRWGAEAPMGAAQSVEHANDKIAPIGVAPPKERQYGE